MRALVTFAVIFALVSVIAIHVADVAASEITATFDHINVEIERALRKL